MPFILHAAWMPSETPFPDGRLFFWAEDSEISDPKKVSPSANLSGLTDLGNAENRLQPPLRTPLRMPKIPSHSSQVSVGLLRSHLVAAFSELAQQLQPTSAHVWLPSQDGAPLSRPKLLEYKLAGAPKTSNGAAPIQTLANWQVTGLATTAYVGLEFLVHLNSQATVRSTTTQTLATGIRLGNDLLFWSNAAKFALQLLVEQHYLPSVRLSAANQFFAAWQPVFSTPEVESRFDQLIHSMPPICRAYNLVAPTQALAPAELLLHFLTSLLDVAIRQWGASNKPAWPQTTAQAWLTGLVGEQRGLQLAPQPAHHLYHAWRSWQEQLHITRDSNFRVCFQLEPPGLPPNINAQTAAEQPKPTTDLWKLRYFLQALDHSQLMVSATEVWEAPHNSLQLGTRWLDQPQERLLAGLGVAARLFAPITRSLKSQKPELVELSTEEAYQFLHEIGPLLKSSGFGILLPEWWRNGEHTRLGLRLRLFSDESSSLPAAAHAPSAEHAPPTTQGVRYVWEITLGGKHLSHAEFEKLTELKSPLVRLGERWMELDPHQVETARRFWEQRQSTGQISFLQAIRLAQSHHAAIAGAPTPLPERQNARAAANVALAALLPNGIPTMLPLDTVEVEGWLETALERLRQPQTFAEIEKPAGFVGTLRPYQQRGVGWLAYLRNLGIGACLADDMGLGKTVQSIALLLHIREQSGQRHEQRLPPALLLCPTSVVANWRREVERFGPMLRVLVHHGSDRITGAAFVQAVAAYDLVITSYGTARRDIEMLETLVWSDLILDEAQNIKNPGAKQTQAVLRLEAGNRIALTGTPVENRLSELWSILHFLNPGYLEGFERFRRHYILPIERYNDDEQAHELRKLVQPFLLRRLKSDPQIIADLPEKNEMVVYCTLTHEQADLYEKVVDEALQRLDQSDGIQRRGLVLSLLTKLKQICNHPAHFLKQETPLAGRSGKLSRLTEMMEEVLAVGDRALIFTQFVEMGHLLQQHLREIFHVEVLFLHGRVPAAQREQMVLAFQSVDGPPIFVLSLRAGGSGLNLTNANHVFHFDRWWNPAVENQATDRAFRIGQRRDVQVHKFVVAGTLEDRIHALIEGKQALANTIVGTGEQWLTELSTDQLRQLLLLRREMAEDE